MNKVETFLSAGTLPFLPARFTLNEQKMTTLVSAVDMRISRLAALVAAKARLVVLDRLVLDHAAAQRLAALGARRRLDATRHATGGIRRR